MYKGTGKPKGAVALSGGHFGPRTGASGVVDEVTEAWKICARVAAILRMGGISVHEFYDKTSKNRSLNIGTIVRWHQSRARALDVSFHLNAATPTAHGCETLYKQKTSAAIAKQVNDATVEAGGFRDRGIKTRTDLGFLNSLDKAGKPAILLETFFCTNKEDVAKYHEHFEDICFGIAKGIAAHVGVTLTKVVQVEKKEVVVPKEKKGDWLMEPVKFASPTMTVEMQEALDSMVKDGLIAQMRADAFRKGELTGVEAVGVLFVVYNRIMKQRGKCC